jgi:hypothetical protein
MGTNKELLSKGIKYLGGALPLLFIGPSIIYNAFINKQNIWHYLFGCWYSYLFGSDVPFILGLNTIMLYLTNNGRLNSHSENI